MKLNLCVILLRDKTSVWVKLVEDRSLQWCYSHVIVQWCLIGFILIFSLIFSRDLVEQNHLKLAGHIVLYCSHFIDTSTTQIVKRKWNPFRFRKGPTIPVDIRRVLMSQIRLALLSRNRKKKLPKVMKAIKYELKRKLLTTYWNSISPETLGWKANFISGLPVAKSNLMTVF